MGIHEKLHLYDDAMNEANMLVEITKNIQYEKEENKIREIEHWTNQLRRIENKRQKINNEK